MKTTPKWAQVDEEVERQNHSIIKRIKIACAEGIPWKIERRKYLLAYCAILHSTTWKSPVEMLNWKKAAFQNAWFYLGGGKRKNWSTNFWSYRESENKTMSKFYTDMGRNSQSSDIDLGVTVLVKRDQMCKTDTPYKIIGKTGSSPVVESPDGVPYGKTPAISRNLKRLMLIIRCQYHQGCQHHHHQKYQPVQSETYTHPSSCKIM